MLLDFYGFEPSSSFASTGAIRLVSVPRVRNLIGSTHNYLRVTRILKSMGELGYEHLKLGLVAALWRESRGERGTQYMRRSCDDYWSGVLRDERDREVIVQLRQGAVSVKEQHEYDELLERRAEERQRSAAGVNEKEDEEKRVGEADHEAQSSNESVSGSGERPSAVSEVAQQRKRKDREEEGTTAAQASDEKANSEVEEKKHSHDLREEGEQSTARKRAEQPAPMSQEL